MTVLAHSMGLRAVVLFSGIGTAILAVALVGLWGATVGTAGIMAALFIVHGLFVARSTERARRQEDADALEDVKYQALRCVRIAEMIVQLVDESREGEALGAYERAARLDAGSSIAHQGRGAAPGMLGRHADTIAAFGRAVEIEPGSAGSHLGRGMALHDIGRHEDALEACRRATELDPDSPAARGTKAAILASLGRHEDALESINRAISLDPNGVRHYVSKGHILEALGRVPDSVAAFYRAIRADTAVHWRAPQG